MLDEASVGLKIYDPFIDYVGQTVLDKHLIISPDLSEFDLIFIGSNNDWVIRFIDDNLAIIDANVSHIYLCYPANDGFSTKFGNRLKTWSV